MGGNVMKVQRMLMGRVAAMYGFVTILALSVVCVAAQGQDRFRDRRPPTREELRKRWEEAKKKLEEARKRREEQQEDENRGDETRENETLEERKESGDKSRVRTPDVENLRLVLRPREGVKVAGMTYHDGKLWASLFQGRGRLATWQQGMKGWALTNDDDLHAAVREAAGSYGDPSGICFYRGNLYIGGHYGDSIGAISPKEGWHAMQTFPGKYKDSENGQDYAAMAVGRDCIWIAWHWLEYDLPARETQLLLKMHPHTGRILAEFPLPPGMRNVPNHGLAVRGGPELWHITDQALSAIDTSTGAVTAQYHVPKIERPFGLAQYQGSLWIAEDNGALWELPFKESAPEAGPDLMVSITGPNQARSGQQIPSPLTIKVTNKGNAPATGYMVDVVLSSDLTLPERPARYSPDFVEDALVAAGRISKTRTLGPGEHASWTLRPVEIPNNTPTGQYYLGAIVDPYGRVDESNEANNTDLHRIFISNRRR